MYKSGHSVTLLCGTCSLTVWKQTSAVLLSQLHNLGMLHINFCYSVTSTPEIFTVEKYSAILLRKFLVLR